MELCSRWRRFFISCEPSCGRPEAVLDRTRRQGLLPQNMVVGLEPPTPNCIDLPCERVLAIIFTTTRGFGAIRHFNASSIARTLWLQVIRRQNDLQFSRMRDRDRRPLWLRHVLRLRC